jgi:AcrR family transcriptional regulator
VTTDNQGQMSGPVTSARTRIINAFNKMVLARRRGPFGVGSIIDHARVARSTFYDHFGNESALQEAALRPAFTTMAATLAGQADASRLAEILAHFWDYRQQLRPLLTSRERNRIEAMLADQVAAQLGGAQPSDQKTNRPCAVQIAAATMATLHDWIAAGFSATPGDLSDQLIAVAAGIQKAYAGD